MNYRYILNALQGIFVSIEEMNYRQEKKQYLSGPTYIEGQILRFIVKLWPHLVQASPFFPVGASMSIEVHGMRGEE